MPLPPAAAQPSLHASGAMLVADDAEAFAAAAVAAMSDAALWACSRRRVSSSSGCSRPRARAPSSARAPRAVSRAARRARVRPFAEAAERAATHALIAAPVRLRVVVHVVLLPAASPPTRWR